MTIQDIIQATADHYGLPAEVLANKDARSLHVTCARHVAMYIANRIAFMTHANVSVAFGVHHTAVVKAVRRVELTRNSQDDIEAIRSRLALGAPVPSPREEQAPLSRRQVAPTDGSPVEEESPEVEFRHLAATRMPHGFRLPTSAIWNPGRCVAPPGNIITR